MTLILGFRMADDRVYLAADRDGFHGGSLRTPLVSPKVFSWNGVGIGACGSFRLMQIVQTMDPIQWDIPVDHDPQRSLIRQFVPALQTACEAGKFKIPDSDDDESADGFSLFVAVPSTNPEQPTRLFCVPHSLEVTESELGYDAMGSAESVALGALGMLLDQMRETDAAMSPNDVAQQVFGVAQRHHTQCGPFCDLLMA